MANVIIFTDVPLRNLGLADSPFYLRYETRPAGAYAIASVLRQAGYSVLVVPHCASYTLSGVKKVIADNAEGLLWAGLSTTFFTTGIPSDSTYRQEWTTTSDLYFADWFQSLLGTKDLTKKNDFLTMRRELIWGAAELNHISEFCAELGVPFLLGGAWVSKLKNGNLEGLHANTHIVPSRAELAALSITGELAEGRTPDFGRIVDNTTYDDIDFKKNIYHWNESDNIRPGEWLPIQISRGCAFNCSFCDFDRRAKVNSYRDPEALRTELIRNYELFGVTSYIVLDDLYNETKEKVRILYDQVWSKLPFKPEWTSYMRLDMIWADPESAVFLKESGARLGSFGLETLHNDAGKKVGKGLGKERILSTLEHLKATWKDDVLIHGYFIAGMPGEPEESIIETINWCKDTPLLDSVSWSPLWITPPEHKKFVVTMSPMSKDYDKYNISWLPNNIWINQQGVTYTRALELSDQGNKARDFFIGAFGDYPEYRQLGWSHEDVVHLKDKRIACTTKLNNDSHIVTDRIISKIKKVLNV